MKLATLVAASLFLFAGDFSTSNGRRNPPYPLLHLNTTDSTSTLVFLCPSGVVSSTGCDKNMGHAGFVVKACALTVDTPSSGSYGVALFHGATSVLQAAISSANGNRSCATYAPNTRTFAAGEVVYMRLTEVGAQSSGGASAQIWVVNTDATD